MLIFLIIKINYKQFVVKISPQYYYHNRKVKCACYTSFCDYS